MDIGFTTENAVKAVRNNVPEKQLLDFCLSCSNFLNAVVAKLLNKTAVQYPLANNLEFLDPRLTYVKSVLHLLVQYNSVGESEVDEVLH